MRIVFTRGMSRPLSMIIVLTSTSNSPSMKSTITRSSCFSLICPCPTAMRRSGSSSCRKAAMAVIVSTRLCTK